MKQGSHWNPSPLRSRLFRRLPSFRFRFILLDLPARPEAVEHSLISLHDHPGHFMNCLHRLFTTTSGSFFVVCSEHGWIDRPSGSELNQVSDHVVLEQVPGLAGTINNGCLIGAFQFNRGTVTPGKAIGPVTYEA